MKIRTILASAGAILGATFIAYAAYSPAQLGINRATNELCIMDTVGVCEALGFTVTAHNNTTLAAISTTAHPFVERDGFSSQYDSPKVGYKAESGTCVANSRVNDGGSCINALDGGSWYGQFGGSPVLALVWGAKCDWNGSTGTNDYEPLTAAFVSGYAVALPDNRGCYSSTGLVLPGGHALSGAYVIPSNPPNGSYIICANTVADCLTAGDSGATAKSASVSNVMVGFSGTPASNSRAIVFQGHNGRCDNIMAFNAYDGLTFVNGLSLHCGWVYTWNITHDHVVQNGAPEFYIISARFGLNGSGDQATSDSFIGLTGANPNGFFCTQCQFNLGGQSPAHLVSYYSVSSQTDGIVNIADSVADMSVGNCTSLIKTDASAFVYRFQISNSIVNAPSCQLIDQATQSQPPVGLQITNNTLLAVGDSTIDTGAESGSLAFDISHNANITGNITLNSGGTGKGIFSHNQMNGNLAISGTWAELHAGPNVVNGSFGDTASGTIYGPTPISPWTPVFKLGATAATSTVTGQYWRQADGLMFVRYGVLPTDFNAGTGVASITGMPHACSNFNGVAGNFPIYLHGAASMTGTPSAEVFTSTIYPVYSGTTATDNNLTDANFTTSSNITGSITCTPN